MEAYTTIHLYILSSTAFTSRLTPRIPGLFTATSQHIRFYFFTFSSYFHLLDVGSLWQIKLTYVSLRVHVKIASRAVS